MKIDKPLAIGLTLIVILVGGYYLILPKYREFKDLRSKISTREAELKAREQYFAQVKTAYERLLANKENIEKIGTALPQDPLIAPLIYFFQEKAKENGLSLKTISLKATAPVKRGSSMKETGFSLQLYGTYKAFKGFVERLEKSSRLIEVGTVSFGAAEGGLGASSEQGGAESSEKEKEQKKGPELRSFDLELKVHSH